MNILRTPAKARSSRWSRPAIALFSGLMAVAAVAIPATADHATRPDTKNQVYKIGGDVSAPKLVYKIEPEYTEAARNAKISGRVVLSMIVDVSGTPGQIKVVSGLDSGLDNNAIAAVSQWRFAPARKKNQAVAVEARVEVDFRLK